MLGFIVIVESAGDGGGRGARRVITEKYCTAMCNVSRRVITAWNKQENSGKTQVQWSPGARHRGRR